MTVLKNAFRWSEKYAVNIAALDSQHQRLFAMVSELDDALAEGKGAAVLEPVLQRLVDYTLSHFAAEEGLMAKHQFPGLGNHTLEHAQFAKKIALFLDDVRAAKTGVPVALLFFLQGWLKHHILVTDKAYSGFLNARGVR